MQSFIINKEIIENRIDPFYYQPEFLSLLNRIKKCLFPLKQLKELVVDIKNGSTPSGGIFEKEGIPYFRSQDFSLFDFKIKQFITLGFHKYLTRSIIKPGDVLIAVVGATLGVIGYVPNEIKEANINQNVARLRVKKEINSKYLAVFLSTKFGQGQLIRSATITTQRYLNTSQLETIKIPLPPRQIQNKIVQIIQFAYEQKKQKESEAQKLLDSIDNYVLSELGIKLPKFKEKKIFAVYSAEVEGKRIDPKYYQPYYKGLFKNLRKSKYNSVNLENLITKSYSGEWGIDINKIRKGEFTNFEICKVIRNTNFDNQFNLHLSNIAIRGIERTKIEKIALKIGDILIEKSGGSPIQPVGRVALIENLSFDRPTVYSNFLQKITVKDCNPQYLFTILKSFHSKGFTEHLQNQTTGIRNLIMNEFLLIPIPLPPLEIQNKISSEVKARREKAKQLKQDSIKLIEDAKQKVEKMILGR